MIERDVDLDTFLLDHWVLLDLGNVPRRATLLKMRPPLYFSRQGNNIQTFFAIFTKTVISASL